MANIVIKESLNIAFFQIGRTKTQCNDKITVALLYHIDYPLGHREQTMLHNQCVTRQKKLNIANFSLANI